MQKDPDWFINTEDKLAHFLAAIANEDWLAVDTEANPMHAYQERVCLIQVSTEREDYVLDPTLDLDLSPFFKVLENPKITKVFHDVEYDLIQLNRQFGVRIRNICDTKVLAVALGSPVVGLAPLVEKYLGGKLDKKFQRSNWGRRPLAPGQIEYARKDTHYLLRLAELLEEKIDQLDSLVQKEVDSELHRLENMDVPKRPKLAPDACMKIKGASTLPPNLLRVLHELFVWRENEAQKRDQPPFKVLGTTQLFALAASVPKTRSAFGEVDGISKSIALRYGAVLVPLIREALSKPEFKPPKGRPTRDTAGLKDDQRAAYDRLKKWRKKQADSRPTDPSHILNREVMSQLVRIEPCPRTLRDLAGTKLLEKWRIKAYGSHILEALARSGAEKSQRKRARKSRRSKKRS